MSHFLSKARYGYLIPNTVIGLLQNGIVASHWPILAKAMAAIGDTNKRPTFLEAAAAVFSSNIQECKTVIVKEPQSDRKSRRLLGSFFFLLYPQHTGIKVHFASSLLTLEFPTKWRLLPQCVSIYSTKRKISPPERKKDFGPFFGLHTIKSSELTVVFTRISPWRPSLFFLFKTSNKSSSTSSIYVSNDK